MWISALCFPVGMVLAALVFHPYIPAHWAGWGLLISALGAVCALVLHRYWAQANGRWVWGAVALLLGISLGSWAHARFDPAPLVPNQTYHLTGVVDDVPKVGRFSRRYRVLVHCLGSQPASCDLAQSGAWWWPIQAELVLDRHQSPLLPGQTIRASVRVRAPRPQSSPAAFNVDHWLRASHIVARLSLQKGASVTVLDEPWWSVDQLRFRLHEHFADRVTPGPSGLSSHAVLLALVTGDRSLMGNGHWSVLNRTGTTHLVAISGLHIGLVATFMVLLTRPLLARWHWFTQRLPARHGALLLAWGVAFYYAAMAGFALPTQRAIIMLSVYVVLTLMGRAGQLWFGLGLAFSLVLLWDPMASLSLGFWLSFTAVYWILWLVGGEVERPSLARQWTVIQWGLFVGLAPILLWWVHSVSLVSAFTNVVAIPLIGFVIVPMALVWVSLWAVLGDQAEWLLTLAAWLMDGMLLALQWVSDSPYSVWTVGERSVVSLVLAMLGAAWLFSAGLPGRGWGLVLLLPLVMPQVQGLGAYWMASGSGRTVLHFPDQVVSISRSHWPQPVALWQAELHRHWGIDQPGPDFSVTGSRALWLSRQPVVSRFSLHTSPLGARRLASAEYGALCDVRLAGAGWSAEPVSTGGKRPNCALVLSIQGEQWLYWPVQKKRAQAKLLEQLASRRFERVILDVGKGAKVMPEILALLTHDGQLISMKPLPEAFITAADRAGVRPYTVAEQGYLYLPEFGSK